MKLRGFAALAALGGTVLLAGAIGGLGSPDAMDADEGGLSVAAKAAFLALPDTAATEQDAAAVAPVADAAVVDVSLLSPHPMLAPSRPPVRLAALGAPEPVEKLAQATGSIRSEPVLPEVKKAIVEPKLDKDGSLNVAQIARIKASLNLTPDQERYWTPVEAELREIARQLAAQKASGKKPKIALGADAAQRLYWAAGPLIMSLREDQKQEVRRLARAMGLEQVASLI